MQAAPLDMMFEPTGILLKDYNAYCEVDGLLERDDLIDAVDYGEPSDQNNLNLKKAVTRLILRNPPRNNLLPQRDFLPMAKAIPHCTNLDVIHFTGCGITDVCIRNLAEAVFKSPSMTSVTVDFNCSSGFAQESKTHKEDTQRPLITDINVSGAAFRNGILAGMDDQAVLAGKRDEKKKHNVSSQPTGAKAKAQAAREAEEQERLQQPIPVPQGWSCLTFSGIQHLCLRGNKINDNDAVAMASHLSEPFSDLRCLNLWGNEITDVGAKALAAAALAGRRLTAIDLGQNRIGDSGAEAFAKIFLTMDATVEEATKMRARTLTILNTANPVPNLTPPPADPLPSMPGFPEIFAANADENEGGEGGLGGAGGASSSSVAPPGRGLSSGGGLRNTPRSRMSKSQSVSGSTRGEASTRATSSGGRKGDHFSMPDRSKADFDRDLVKLEDGKIRVPGCCQIVSLSLAHNPPMTDRGVAAFEKVLKTCEPQRADECGSSFQLGGGANVPQYCSTLNLQRLEIGNTNISDAVMNKLQLAVQKVIARRST